MITEYIDFSFRQYFIVVNSQNEVKRLEDGPESHVETKKSRIWIKLSKFTNSLKKSAHVVLFLRKIDLISRETYSLRVK